MAEGDTTRISADGAVVLPQALREQLGLVPGTEVSLKRDDQSIVIAPVVTAEESRLKLDAWFNYLDKLPRPTMSADELMSLTRGED